MDDLAVKIDDFIDRKSVSSHLPGKKNPPPSKVIIPSKLNYNPVTLERINKQLMDIINKMNASRR